MKTILRPSELGDIAETLTYHVAGILPTHSLVTLWAPSGIGKTFVMLDLALHVAAGRDWHGQAVTQGPVLYVVGEGFAGLPARVQAWCTAHQCDLADLDPVIGFRRVPFDVADPEMCAEVRRELEALAITPTLVILDTLSANTPPGWDESKTADMKLFLDGARGLRDELGCSVVIVHHTGHDQSRERGSSDLRAAMDVSLSLKATAGDVRVLTVEKARDFAAPDPIRLVLRAAHGARVVERPDAPEQDELTPSMRSVLRVLAEEGQGEPLRVTDWQRVSPIRGGQFYEIRGALERFKLVLNVPKRGYVLSRLGEELVHQWHAQDALAAELLHSCGTPAAPDGSARNNSYCPPMSIHREDRSSGEPAAA